jgi:serine/threonine protein kinase
MSPEQASGKSVDKRADIWSFGAVLYEMLSGKKAFEGESISDTLATVMKLEPDWSALPRDVPASVQTLVRRCLTKDRKQRLRDIGEARIAIDNASKTSDLPVAATVPHGRPVAWIFATAAMVILAAVAVFGWWRATRNVEHSLLRFSDDLGNELYLSASEGPAIALSPDGLRLAYVSLSPDGRTHLSLRILGSSKSIVLSGTEGAPATAPFFSPDSRWIGFFSGQRLKKISVEGDAVVTLCDVGPSGPRGAFWGEDGRFQPMAADFRFGRAMLANCYIYCLMVRGSYPTQRTASHL